MSKDLLATLALIIIFIISIIIFLFFKLDVQSIIEIISSKHDIVIRYLDNNYFLFCFVFILASTIYYCFPIPSIIPIFLGGYLFQYYGSIFSLLALIFSSIFTYLLFRTVIKSRTLFQLKNKYSKFFKKYDFSYILLVSLFIPHFFVSAIAGSLRINFTSFIIASTLGNIPYYFAWNYIGLSSRKLIDDNIQLSNESILVPSLLWPFIILITLAVIRIVIVRRLDQ